jgi:hypothetical protein
LSRYAPKPLRARCARTRWLEFLKIWSRRDGSKSSRQPHAHGRAAVSVKLQRKKKGGGWKTLKTFTTSDTGAYSSKVKNKAGRYRSVLRR